MERDSRLGSSQTVALVAVRQSSEGVSDSRARVCETVERLSASTPNQSILSNNIKVNICLLLVYGMVSSDALSCTKSNRAYRLILEEVFPRLEGKLSRASTGSSPAPRRETFPCLDGRPSRKATGDPPARRREDFPQGDGRPSPNSNQIILLTLNYYNDMRKTSLLTLAMVSLLLGTSCGEKKLDPTKPVYVKVETTMGDVTVRLYDETPLHRDNFIRLCQENAYEGVLFHRIIKEFVVQGGDPDSRAHEPGKLYGENGGGYTVPAEILPQFFNKRGALIDAKEGDDVNPERASAGTQFCFVQGKVWDDAGLDGIENRINQIREAWLYSIFRHRLLEQHPDWASEENAETLHMEATLLLQDTLATLPRVVIPKEHREVYKTIGGTPHLDGSVTIFGEVVEGLDIVEKMSLVETDGNDRPVKDVVIEGTEVFQ